ncbi:unnamed protein product [Prunus armeniaca]|uniref:Uncharacterized protein n=1 Tax=Prunus armeniaca TaxID=36596 RepID=A0A6J5UMU0_PRUAR|nr:unnamed protein product [Prunus armeniaca]CAB4308275.1 unnamed protein product [Prunus armeniaca]
MVELRTGIRHHSSIPATQPPSSPILSLSLRATQDPNPLCICFSLPLCVCLSLSRTPSPPRPKPSIYVSLSFCVSPYRSSSRSREPDLVAVLRGLGGRSGLAKWRSGLGFLRDKVVMWAGSGGGGAVEKMMTLDFVFVFIF